MEMEMGEKDGEEEEGEEEEEEEEEEHSSFARAAGIKRPRSPPLSPVTPLSLRLVQRMLRYVYVFMSLRLFIYMSIRPHISHMNRRSIPSYHPIFL